MVIHYVSNTVYNAYPEADLIHNLRALNRWNLMLDDVTNILILSVYLIGFGPAGSWGHHQQTIIKWLSKYSLQNLRNCFQVQFLSERSYFSIFSFARNVESLQLFIALSSPWIRAKPIFSAITENKRTDFQLPAFWNHSPGSRTSSKTNICF